MHPCRQGEADKRLIGARKNWRTLASDGEVGRYVINGAPVKPAETPNPPPVASFAADQWPAYQ